MIIGRSDKLVLQTPSLPAGGGQLYLPNQSYNRDNDSGKSLARNKQREGRVPARFDKIHTLMTPKNLFSGNIASIKMTIPARTLKTTMTTVIILWCHQHSKLTMSLNNLKSARLMFSCKTWIHP